MRSNIDTSRWDGDSNWPCGIRCDRDSQCIQTRTKSFLCVRQIVQIRKPKVGRGIANLSINHRPKPTSPSTTSNKGSAQRSSPTGTSSEINPTNIIKVKPTQPIDSPTVTLIEGLLTISTIKRTHKQFNLMILSTKAWHPIHTIKGRVTALRSRGNHVYWCQKAPTKCARFKVIPGNMTVQVLESHSVSGTDIAVDEDADTVVVAKHSTRLYIYFLTWTIKMSFVVGGQPSRIAVNPRNRLLYVALRHRTDVMVFDYAGIPLFNFTLNHVTRSIDVDPTGEMLYSSGGDGTLAVVSLEYFIRDNYKTTAIHVGHLTSTARVLAYNTRLYIATDRTLRAYDKKGPRIQKTTHYPMPKSQCDRTSPIVSFIGRASSEKEEECSKLTSDSTQTILVARKHTYRDQRSTTLFRYNFPNGSWDTFRNITGDLVHLVMSDSTLYHCQKEPSGLYRSTLKDGKWLKEIKLFDGVCHNVAVDSRQLLVFFIWDKGLKKHNLARPVEIGNKGAKCSKVSAMSLDTVEGFIYMVTRGEKNIQRLSYDGCVHAIIKTRDRIRELQVSLTDSYLYYTTKENRKLLKSAPLPDPRSSRKLVLHIGKTLCAKLISTFHIMSDKVVVAHKTTLKIFCRSTLQMLATKDFSKYSLISISHLYVTEIT